jgi:hypothetical protein
MQKRFRPHQQSPIARQHHNAVRQSGPPFRRNPSRKRRALQRRKPERAPGAIVLQDELHGAMAQPAMSIVKEIFRARRVWHRRQRIARARSTGVPHGGAVAFEAIRGVFGPRQPNREYRNAARFALATLSETL